MVQRTGAGALGGIRAFPAFPDGGGAQPGHGQPAGDLLVFQQPVGSFNVNICQYVQNQRGREETGTQPPAVIFQRLDQPILGKGGLSLC